MIHPRHNTVSSRTRHLAFIATSSSCQSWFTTVPVPIPLDRLSRNTLCEPRMRLTLELERLPHCAEPHHLYFKRQNESRFNACSVNNSIKLELFVLRYYVCEIKSNDFLKIHITRFEIPMSFIALFVSMSMTYVHSVDVCKEEIYKINVT